MNQTIYYAVVAVSLVIGGQISIEHLTGFIDPDAADFVIPEDQLVTYAEMTHESGVWNCPTIRRVSHDSSSDCAPGYLK